MGHWIASSLLGLVLTGRFQPVCAAVYAAPDCTLRRAFLRLMDVVFAEKNHCRKIWMIYRISRHLRG